MVPQHSKFKEVFDERVRSLIKDHYCKRVDCRLPHLWIVRLKHMSNGNEVVLAGYPADRKIMQWTNKILRHKEFVD